MGMHNVHLLQAFLEVVAQLKSLPRCTGAPGPDGSPVIHEEWPGKDNIKGSSGGY